MRFCYSASRGTILLFFFFEFGPVIQQEMSFKDISFLELWCPICSAERNQLCNFGRVRHQYFSEIIVNLNQWFGRFLKRHFISGSQADHVFGGVEPFVQNW